MNIPQPCYAQYPENYSTFTPGMLRTAAELTRFNMTDNKPQIIYCTARAYSTALLIEKYAAKYDCGTPLQIAHQQIIEAHAAGCDEGRKLMLEVYKILIARNHTDGNVRFVWLDDDEADGETGGDNE